MSNVLVIDTETFGLSYQKDSLLSVGAMVGELSSGKILSTYESLVKLPSMDSYHGNAQALTINKLSIRECFEKGKTPQQIGEDLLDLHTKYPSQLLGGHNMIFDVNFISKHIYNCSYEEFTTMFGYRFLDSCTAIRLIMNDEIASGASLTKASKGLNIDMSDINKSKAFHTALYDAIASFRIMVKFHNLFKNPMVIAELKK